MGDDQQIWVVNPEDTREIELAQAGHPIYQPGTNTPIPANMQLYQVQGATGYAPDGRITGVGSDGGQNGKFFANPDGSNRQFYADPKDNSNFVSDVIKPQVKGAFEFAPVAAAVVAAAYGLPAAYTALGGSMAAGATAAGTGLAEGGTLTAGAQTGANAVSMVSGDAALAPQVGGWSTTAAASNPDAIELGYQLMQQTGAPTITAAAQAAGYSSFEGYLQAVNPELLSAAGAAAAAGGAAASGNAWTNAQGGSNVLDSLKSITPLGTLAATQLAGSLIGANAAKNAGQLQADAANRAADQNMQMFNTLNAQGAPYRQAGYNALGEIGRLTPQFEHQFDANDLKNGLAPNYDFQLEQGLKAVKNAGNMQTGLLSGNTLQGINNYAQDYAGGAYQNAFNNYNTNQTNIFNRLSSIAGLGQTANAQSSQSGTNIAGNVGNAQIAAGQGQAAGQVGTANAIAGGLNNAASWYALPDILKMAQGRTA